MNRERREPETAYFPPKSYRLNADDHFVWFSPEWNLEFRDTLGESYDAEDYLGRSFYELLDGVEIQLIYRSVFRSVRRTHGQRLSLTLRCDRFPLKIFMRQDLSGYDDGSIGVQLSYTKLEIVSMPQPALSLDQNQPLKMCSWCQSIFDSVKVTWLPLEKALGYFPLLHDHELPVITHGCCPVCYQTLRGKLHEYSGGRR
ncbi:MAG TPA: hypothetical protein VFO10_30225 [Oligoflexus sp.]|uniref:hypothetical protein n=1 Tax=Oligoflexus sp. TaxID=1971216 RepID=UPI002D7FB596|nr:hypothetical protein [Oligoflexus sp.]HET9241582.1 hypothetical protein [Oligoflexus sp.]